jgi:hypothetical protein
LVANMFTKWSSLRLGTNRSLGCPSVASQADTFGSNRLEHLVIMRLAFSPSQLLGTKVSGAILQPPLLIRVLFLRVM